MTDGLRGALVRLGRQSAVYLAGNVVSKLAAFVVLLPVYTHYLTPADFGVLSVCVAIVSVLIPLTSLGLAGAVTRFNVECGSDEERRRLMGTLGLTMLLSALLIIGLIEVVGTRYGDRIFRDIPYDPYLRLTIWAALLNTLVTLPSAMLRVQERPWAFCGLVYGGSLFKIALSAYFLIVLERGLLGAIEAIFWANALLVPFYLAPWLRHASLRVSRRWLVRSLAFGLPLVPHSLAQWIMSLSDRVILEAFVDHEQLGLYSLAYQIVLVAAVMMAAMNSAYSPYVINRHKREGIAQLLPKLSTYFVLIVVVLLLGALLFARYAIFLMATPAYYGAIDVVLPIGIGYLFYGLYFVPVLLLFLEQQTGRLAVVTICAALANVVLNLIFIPRFGIQAAAWTTAASYGLMFMGVFGLSRRARLARFEYRRVLTAIALGAGVVSADLALVNAVGPRSPGAFAVSLGLFLAFPVLLLQSGFFDASERRLIRRALARVGLARRPG